LNNPIAVSPSTPHRPITKVPQNPKTPKPQNPGTNL
jgi:hypothetical protein